MRGIAKACGMQAGSLYYHFASKDEIVSEILNIGVQRVFDAVQQAIAALPADAGLKQVVQTGIAAHLSGLLLAHDFTSANIRIFWQVPLQVRANHTQLRKKYENYWHQLLMGWQKKQAIRPGVNLQMIVLFLFGTMNWTTEWSDGKKSDIQALSVEMAELFCNGLEKK